MIGAVGGGRPHKLMWGRPLFFLLLATGSFLGCSGPSDPPAAANAVAPSPVTASSLAAAQRAIAAEPKVRAVEYSAPRWRVAVDDDGTRRDGYAQYLCLVIGEQGARDDRTEVEVIDQANGERQLAILRCSTVA